MSTDDKDNAESLNQENGAERSENEEPCFLPLEPLRPQTRRLMKR